ncbi:MULTISPECIES: hypothetical protein [unclassified Sphingobium]|uniref:hypothetical protein n=1 Tax=unclassified Sphingobium TaxID=2611147 RepID=UPI0035A70FE7
MVSAINGSGNAWGLIKKTVETVTTPVTQVLTPIVSPPPAPSAPAPAPEPTPAPADDVPAPSSAPAAETEPLTYLARSPGRPQLNAPASPQTTLARQLTEAGFYYSGPESAAVADPVATSQQVSGDALSRAQIVAQAAYSLVASAREDDRLTLIQNG